MTSSASGPAARTTTTDLPRTTPRSTGIDGSGITDFLDDIAERGLELHSLMVLRRGEVLAEGWFSPYSADRRHLVYSISKSFTGTAAGLLIGEGRLALSDRVVSFFPDLVPDPVDPKIAALTVHHVLSMSTGRSSDSLTSMLMNRRADPVRAILSVPPEGEPGSRHIYDNGATYLVGAIIEQVTGERVIDYLRPRLLEPLGITGVAWMQDPGGRDLSFSGFYAHTEDLAKLGELYRSDGMWNGERILPKGWVALATSSKIDTDYREEPEWQHGYGYQVWMAEHGYRFDGAFGQFVLVLPELESVIAITSGELRMGEIGDVAAKHLVPMLAAATSAGRSGGGADTSTRAADEDLADRLARLELTVRPAPTETASWSVLGPVIGPPVPADMPARPEDLFPPLSDVSLAEIDDVWMFVARENGLPLVIECGIDAWTENLATFPDGRAVPLVARAWPGTDGAHVEIVGIETPHRVLIDIAEENGETVARARWSVPPLHGRKIVDLGVGRLVVD